MCKRKKKNNNSKYNLKAYQRQLLGWVAQGSVYEEVNQSKINGGLIAKLFKRTCVKKKQSFKIDFCDYHYPTTALQLPLSSSNAGL